LPLDFLIYLLAGAAAGFLGGLLGVGGGLLVVAALSVTLPASGIPPSQVIHVAVATALAGMVVTFASATVAHLRKGGILGPTWLRLAPGLALGSVVGSRLAHLMSGPALRLVVAGFCVLVAGQMVFGRTGVRAEADHVPRSPWLVAGGFAIAVISAVVGIGGGSLTVPLLVGLGVRPVRAVATSAACGLVIALSSAASNVLSMPPPLHPAPWGMAGLVYLPAAAATAVAALAAAPFGVSVANRISGKALRKLFALFLLGVGGVIATGG